MIVHPEREKLVKFVQEERIDTALIAHIVPILEE